MANYSNIHIMGVAKGSCHAHDPPFVKYYCFMSL